MPIEVILPRVDMDMATGKISKWYIDEGATVEKGQPLFEIETDKAAMEVEAPATGQLRDVVTTLDTEIPVGVVIARIFAPGESYQAADPADGVSAAAIEETLEDAGAQPAAPVAAAATASGLDAAPSAEASERPRATPLARTLARQNRVDLAAVAGSGPRGRITSADVREVLTRTPAPASAAAPVAATASTAWATTPSAPASPAPAIAGGTLNRAWLRQGGGAPLVLLHGFGADLNAWRPLLSGVSLDRPVLAIDLPGHGRSPLSLAPSLESFASAVVDVLESEGITAADLIGHSTGGAVAAAVAEQARAEIRSLMLIASAGLGAEINGAFLAGLARATSEASVLPWLRVLFADEAYLAAGFVKARLAQRALPGTAEAEERIVHAFYPDSTQAFSIRPILARLTMPVKVLHGTADRVVPVQQTAGLPGTVALHLLQGVGHMPQVEAKGDVVRLLQELLRSAA